MDTLEKKVAELEEIYSTHDAHFHTIPPGFEYYVDIVIHMLAQYEKTTPLGVIFASEEINPLDASLITDAITIEVATFLHKYWYENPGLVDSDLNLLNDKTGEGEWQDRYQTALARTVIRLGKLVSVSPSIYGWQDFDTDLKTNPPVAVLTVKEDRWDEFTDTFADTNDHKHGVMAEVVLKDGSHRHMRLEGTIRTLVPELFKS